MAKTSPRSASRRLSKMATKSKTKPKTKSKAKLKPKPKVKAKGKIVAKSRPKPKATAKRVVKPKPKVAAKKNPSVTAAAATPKKLTGKSASIRELTVDIKRYSPEPEPPLPSLFANGHMRSIYPYNHRLSQMQHSEIVPMRVVRLANEYIEADFLPDVGGHLWGAKDLVSGREMFHRVDALKHQDLGVAGAWLASGIEFNFPVTHSILTLEKVQSTHGIESDGSAWIRFGAVDKLFGLQWQMTLRLRPGARTLEIDGWLHNPTDQEQPFCYWGNAGFSTHDSLRLYYPFRHCEHHGGRMFKWPHDNGVDFSKFNDCKEVVSVFGDCGDKRYFGGYYEDLKFGMVHTADPKTVPGKKYFTWGNGKRGERWGSLLSEKSGNYVELQSGTRNDQEFWSVMKPHETIAFTERWSPIDGLGGITDANEWITVFVGRENGKAVVRAQSTEPLKKVKFTAYTDKKKKIATWEVDLHPTEVHTKVLNFDGPVRLEVDPHHGPDMVLKTEDFELYHYGPVPKSREEVRDPSEISADHYRELARNQMQVFNWKEANVYYEAARKLDETDARLNLEVGLFRLRRMEFVRARSLLRDLYEKGHRDTTLQWGLLRCAWALHDTLLEKTILSTLEKSQLDLAKTLTCLHHADAAGAVALLKKYTPEALVLQRDLAVAALVARRLVGKPDANLLKALDAVLPLDPVVRFEAADGSIKKLLEVDIDIGITLADTYLKYGDPASALKAVETTAQVRGAWQFNYLVLAEHCAVHANDARAGTFLKQPVHFDALAERPWQDCFYTAIPEVFGQTVNDPRLHYLYGNLLQRYGRSDEALMQWRRSMNAGGDWLQLHLATALVECSSTHHSALNIGCLRSAAEQSHDPQVDEYYFEALRHTGRREDLLEEYRKRLKRPECNPVIRVHYALELALHRLYPEALDFMQATDFPASHGGSKLSRTYLACRIAQGRDLADKEQWELAKKEILKGFILQPNFNEDCLELRCLAEAFCLLGEIETKQSYADIARGEKTAADGHAEAARVWYEKAAAEDHPLTSHLRIWKAKGLMHSVKAAEGEETIQRVQRWISGNLALPHDTHAIYHWNKSHLFRIKGDVVRAKQEEEIAFRTGISNFGW